MLWEREYKPIRGIQLSSKFGDRATITKEGLPIGTFWGYEVTGMDGEGNFLIKGADGTDKSIAKANETVNG